MKNLKFFLALLCMICLYSCSLTDNPEDSFQNNYFPLSIGNYWIFERVAVDANNNAVGEVFRDSLAVTGVEMIDGIKSYQITMFREGLKTQVGFLTVKNSKINIYNKGLIPFLYSDSINCWTKLHLRWFHIFDYFNNSWSIKDSVIADSIPSLVYDPIDQQNKVIYTILANIFNIRAERQVDGVFQLDSKQYKTANFNFCGERIYRYVDTTKAKFMKAPGYKLFDSDRAAIVNEYNLKISFAEHIGISQIQEKLVTGPDSVMYRYNLIRYQLNFIVPE
jgi:hypothetical protein